MKMKYNIKFNKKDHSEIEGYFLTKDKLQLQIVNCIETTQYNEDRVY